MCKEYSIEIVVKILGNINPIGESNYDEKCYENLLNYHDLLDNLIDEIGQLVSEKNSFEGSRQKIGKKSMEILKDIKDCIDDYL